VLTSQEAADVRGVSLNSGAKAIVLAAPGDYEKLFYLAVMSAGRRFDSKAFRKIIKTKKLRFATNEEVYELSGCLSGAVPPSATYSQNQSKQSLTKAFP